MPAMPALTPSLWKADIWAVGAVLLELATGRSIANHVLGREVQPKERGRASASVQETLDATLALRRIFTSPPGRTGVSRGHTSRGVCASYWRIESCLVCIGSHH